MKKKKSKKINEQQLFMRGIKLAHLFFLGEKMCCEDSKDKGELFSIINMVSENEKLKKMEHINQEEISIGMTEIKNTLFELYEYFEYTKAHNSHYDYVVSLTKEAESIVKNNMRRTIDDVSIESLAVLIHETGKYLFRTFISVGGEPVPVEEFKSEVSDEHIKVLKVAHSLFLLGNLVFILKEKPKNALIKDAKINDDGKISYVYSNVKILNQDHISRYCINNDFFDMVDSFMESCMDDWFTRYTLTLSKVADKVELKYFTKGVWSIASTENLCMPFFKACKIENNFENKMEIEYTDISLTKDLMENRHNQKYAIPKEGCEVVFKSMFSNIKKMIIKDLGDEYYFEAYFKEKQDMGAFDEKISGEYYIPKENIEKMLDSLVDMDTVPTGDVWCFRSDKSIKIDTVRGNADDVTYIFNYLCLHCLHLVYNHLDCKIAYVRNVDTFESNQRRYIQRYLKYHTAIVEKDKEIMDEICVDTEHDCSLEDRFTSRKGYRVVKEVDEYIEHNLKLFNV